MIYTDPQGSNQAPNDNAKASGTDDESLKQKLARWDQERHKQIQAGILRSGLLVDFDYVTDLDQNLPIVSSDRTVSIITSTIHLTHNFDQGTIPFMSANIFLNYKPRVSRRTAP